jgi:acetyl esterase/lipase
MDAQGPLTAVIGHSAGGHLALWAAKELTPRPRVVVSVGGCNDLGRAQHINAGNGAVDDFLGGPGKLAELVAADPARRVPLGAKTLLIVPDDDGVVNQSLSESYFKTASAAGDDVVLQRVAGDHFSILDVGSQVWSAVTAAVDAAT